MKSVALITILLILGCLILIRFKFKLPHTPQTWMSSPATQDELFTNPSILLSSRIPNPSEEQKQQPVVIGVHGFSASTRQLEEFAQMAEPNGILVSRVLMAGHGKDLYAFQNSKWKQWQKSIVDEYQTLAKLGYTNISIIAISASGAATLEAIATNKLQPTSALNNIILIDPFIVPASPSLKYAKYAAPLIACIPVEENRHPERNKYWYSHFPTKALVQLEQLVNVTRDALSKGITIPSGAVFRLYQASGDDVSNPNGAKLVKRQVKHQNGTPAITVLVDSKNHGFIETKYRDEKHRSVHERAVQKTIIEELIGILKDV